MSEKSNIDTLQYTMLPTSQAGPVTRVTSPRLPLFAITAATLAKPRALQLPLALGTSPLLYSTLHSVVIISNHVCSPYLRRVPYFALQVHIRYCFRGLLLSVLHHLPNTVHDQTEVQKVLIDGSSQHFWDETLTHDEWNAHGLKYITFFNSFHNSIFVLLPSQDGNLCRWFQ